VFFVSVVSKGFSVPISAVESTLMRQVTTAHSKGLRRGRLRLKTGKTRCSSGSAHSKRLKGIAGRRDGVVGQIPELGDGRQGIGIRRRGEFGDR
jgi:hypothetical protein